MNYEKAYKESIERAKKLQETCDSQAVVGWMEYVFPELKESNDNDILKDLLAEFKDELKEITLIIDNTSPSDCCDELDIQRKKILEKRVDLLERLSQPQNTNTQKKFNPGDVLKCTTTGKLWIRCSGGDNRASDGHTACIGGGYVLANEEERDRFFDELGANGYRWSCSIKRPVKIDQYDIRQWIIGYLENKILNSAIIDEKISCRKAIEWLKSIDDYDNWSKDDDAHVDSIYRRLEGMCKNGATFTRTRFTVSEDEDWIKSLKDRFSKDKDKDSIKISL